MENAPGDAPILLAYRLNGVPIPLIRGGPVRVIVPYAYGFKSVKSIVRINFTDQRPKTFWEALQASEYGFWANVNPEVDHPRCSDPLRFIITGTDSRFFRAFQSVRTRK